MKDKTKKSTLSSLEDILNSNSTKPKHKEKKDVTLTHEIKVVEPKPGIIFQKRKAKVQMTFRFKSSTMDKVEELLKEFKIQNKNLTRTDVINFLLEKGIESISKT